MYRFIFTAASMATLALARTDLSGCVSTDVSSPAGASIAWYVPGTGEICDFLDCGGGRAPPKTTVPGCAAYSGTATYSPSYLPGYGPNAAPSTASPPTTSTGVAPPSAYESSAEDSPAANTSASSELVHSPSSASDVPATAVPVPSTIVTSPAIYTTQAPAVIGGGNNNTAGSAHTTGASANGTHGGPSYTQGPIQANAGAKVWVGVGSAAVVGLGALVAAL